MNIFVPTVSAKESWPEGIDITSETGIVMEANTGTVLYSKKMNQKMYPASITKIMTALLAIENCDLDEVVTFSADAIYKGEGTNIARDVGEQMTLEQCLYALLLGSCNQCAYAIGEHVTGGDISAFVDMMNEKAQSLGCKNTHFNNSSGLPDENHYTSAYDMALICQEALKNETFAQIVNTKTYTIPPTNKHEEETVIANHHAMIYPYKVRGYVYEYCIGGKTGYTNAAQNTLVTFAEKDGLKLICVVMKTVKPYQYQDTTNLFNYCFENFTAWNVMENETRFSSDTESFFHSADKIFGENSSFVEMDASGTVVLPSNADFNDATMEIINNDGITDNVIGRIEYTYGGKYVGGTDLLATEYEGTGFDFDSYEEKQQEVQEESNVIVVRPYQIVILIVAIILIALLTVGFIYLHRNFYIIRHRFRQKSQNFNYTVDKDKTLKRKRSKRQRRNRRGGIESEPYEIKKK
jgi:D-alanyl-D-alanine carboxypeptidase